MGVSLSLPSHTRGGLPQETDEGSSCEENYTPLARSSRYCQRGRSWLAKVSARIDDTLAVILRDDIQFNIIFAKNLPKLHIHVHVHIDTHVSFER